MGFAVLETVATFGGFASVTHGFDGEWSYRGETRTWCGRVPTGNLSRTHQERSTVLEVTCKGCLRTVDGTVTVMVLEPCCAMTEPGYDPGPRPVYNRIPGGWPPRCRHCVPRVPTFTSHTELETVRAEFAKTRGWGSTDGYVHNGVMPPEGERFRIMPVDGYRHGAPWEIGFPTVDVARRWAAQWHDYPDGKRYQYPSLVNVVGDRDTVVRWSSYGIEPGTELTPHQHA